MSTGMYGYHCCLEVLQKVLVECSWHQLHRDLSRAVHYKKKKGTQEMIEVMSWYESWICMQIILVLIPPRQSAAFDFGGPPIYSTRFCKSPANCSMPPVWPFKALFEFACINCLTKSIIRWEEQSSLFALLYWYALPLKTVAIMSQNFRP